MQHNAVMVHFIYVFAVCKSTGLGVSSIHLFDAGFMTGECIESKRYPGNKACEVLAWCPTEDGSRKK